MRFPSLLACALLVSARVLAQPSSEKAPLVAPAPLGQIKDGELRLDGQISAIVEARQWELSATSWSSPGGKTISFPEAKRKTIRLSARSWAHLDGSALAVALDHIACGTPVALLGRNAPDGALEAREVIVFRPNGEVPLRPGVAVDPEAARWCAKAREALRKSDVSAAIVDATQALDAAQACRDRAGERLALKWRAVALEQAHQPEREFADYQQLQVLAQASADAEDEAKGWNGQAAIEIARGKGAAALFCSLKAVALPVNDAEIRCFSWNNVMGEYLMLGRNEEALRVAPIVLELAGQSHNETLVVCLHIDVASLQFYRHDPSLEPSIEENIAAAREHLPKISDAGSRAEMECRLAKLLWYRGDHAGAHACVESACADFALAKRVPEADRARINWQRWQAGASPYASDSN